MRFVSASLLIRNREGSERMCPMADFMLPGSNPN